MGHTLPLWDVENRLAGGFGDPLAHASMPGWYCAKVLTWDLHTTQFLAPAGVDLNNNYDSPFPLVLTCAFQSLGPHAQFHIFAALEILLILLTAWLVARRLFPDRELWQIAYIGFAWWTGFYMARVHQHYTLLAGIWGFQAMIWMALTLDWRNWKRMAGYGAVAGLVFVGTFHNIAMLSVPFAILLGRSLWRAERNLKTLASVTVAGMTLCLTFFFFFGPSLLGYLAGDLPRAFGDRGLYNLDLASPLLPWMNSKLYEWFGVTSPLDFERYNGLDLVVFALVVVAAVRRELLRLPLAKPLLAIALLSWLCSLGPEFRFWGQVLTTNPLESLIGTLPPFGFSRTPARFFIVSVLALTFLAFAFLATRKLPAWLPLALIAWVALTGPALNGEWTVPTVEFRPIFPMQALGQIRSDQESKIVLTIPTALASDPTHNFMQLFHQKPITSGYLAYTAHTPKALAFMNSDPILSQMNCDGAIFAFRGDGIFTTPELVRAHLIRTGIRYVIANKMLIAQPQCQKLMAGCKIWVANRGYASLKKIKDSPFYKSSDFWWLTAILAVTALVFGYLLSAPRLTWDDDSNIFANPFYKMGLWQPFWVQSYFGLYVPVTSTVWQIVFTLGGGEVWPFRVLNLLLHAGCVILVYFMLRDLMRRWELDRTAVLIAVTVFALHPLQVHTVAWISGGRDLLSTFLALSALAVYFSRNTWNGFALATFLFLLALLAKPAVVVLPAIVVILNWILHGKPSKKIWAQMAIWGAFSFFVIILTRQAQQAFLDQDISLFQRGLIMLDTYSFYLQKFIFPYPLSANYGRTPQVALADPGMIWSALLGLGILGGLLLLAWRTDRRYALIAVWFIALLPVSGIVNFGFQLISTVSDHYNYMPMAALAALIALMLSRIDWRRLTRFAEPAILVALIMGLGFMSWQRVHAWEGDAAFFTDMQRTAPDSYSTAIGMSVVECDERKNYDDGVRWTEKALKAQPNDIKALANQAYCYLHAKNYFRVMELEYYLDKLDLEELEASQPTAYSSLLASIGTAYVEQQQYEDGYQFLCEAYRVLPSEPSHARNLQIGARILQEHGITPNCESPERYPEDDAGGAEPPEPVEPVWPPAQ